MYFQPVPVGFEPRPDVPVLVIRGVILDQNPSLTAVSPRQLFQKSKISGGIEDGILAIVEARAPEFNSAEDLYILPLARDGYFRRRPYAAPGGVERRVLPEAGFVCEDERPVSRAGFFLSSG
jgi:hypothetical protein